MTKLERRESVLRGHESEAHPLGLGGQPARRAGPQGSGVLPRRRAVGTAAPRPRSPEPLGLGTRLPLARAHAASRRSKPRARRRLPIMLHVCRRSLRNGLGQDGTSGDAAGCLLPTAPGGYEVRARFCWGFRTARRGFDSRRLHPQKPSNLHERSSPNRAGPGVRPVQPAGSP